MKKDSWNNLTQIYLFTHFKFHSHNINQDIEIIFILVNFKRCTFDFTLNLWVEKNDEEKKYKNRRHDLVDKIERDREVKVAK